MKAGKTTVALILVLGVVVSSLVVLGIDNEASAQRSEKRTRSARRESSAARVRSTNPSEPPKTPLPARFTAVVYQLKLTVDVAEKMDVAAISARVSDNTEFRKKLAKLGKVGFAYSVDQQVNLSEPAQMQTMQRVPMVTGSQITESGNTINTVRYQKVGAMFEVQGTQEKVDDENAVNLRINAEVSSLIDSTVETVPGVRSPVIVSNQLRHNVLAEFGKPFAAMAVSSIGKAGEPGEVIAHVFRFRIAKVGD